MGPPSAASGGRRKSPRGTAAAPPKRRGDGAPGWSPCCVINGPITVNHRPSPAEFSSVFHLRQLRHLRLNALLSILCVLCVPALLLNSVGPSQPSAGTQ